MPLFCLYEEIRQAEQSNGKNRAIIAPIRTGTERHDFSPRSSESQATDHVAAGQFPIVRLPRTAILARLIESCFVDLQTFWK